MFIGMIRNLFVSTCILVVLCGYDSTAEAQCDTPQLLRLSASDAAANDWFGHSVAVFGDTALVGAPYEDNAGGQEAGSAYVFIRSGSTWIQQAKLLSSDFSEHAEFGYSVSLSGDTALIGAYKNNYTGVSLDGAAYIFVRTGVVWSQQAKLIASDLPVNVAQFGYSVGLSGDTAVIGMPPGNGAAYIFVRSGTVWNEQVKLLPLDLATNDTFGHSVAISNDTVVIGSPNDDVEGGNSGSAYVFIRTGVTWTQQAKLTAQDGAGGDEFGSTVAISDDTIVVGAARDDHMAGDVAGSAYVFVRTNGLWTQQAKLIASDAAAGDGFGFAVAISENTSIVGSPGDDNGDGAGTAYVFARNGDLWSQQSEIVATNPSTNDWFGIGVAISGDTVCVGSRYDDHAGGIDAGSAYVLDLDCDGDLVLDSNDNCFNEANPTQANTDADTFGDSCDNCPLQSNQAQADGDADGVGDECDNCPVVANGPQVGTDNQLDSDADQIGDACDICPNNSPSLPTDCSGRPLRDCNHDCAVDALDILCIVEEMISQ